MSRKAVVLFAGGAGAWELGLEWAGVQVVASCEADPVRREMLAANHPGTLLYDDVQTLTAERLIADGAFQRGERPWLVAGSPPCQDASLAAGAKRRGLEGERTGLFRHHVRLVRELRPDWMGAENVAGLTVGECERILGWLGADYRGWQHRVGDEDVGAPQRAWRRWLIARRLPEAAQEPVRRSGQPWDASPGVPPTHQDRLRGAALPAGDGVRPPARLPHASPDQGGQRDGAVDGGPLARSASGLAARGAHWRGDDGLAALGRSLRMANGLSTGPAVAAYQAYGDSFPPQLAEAWARAMMAADAVAAELAA